MRKDDYVQRAVEARLTPAEASQAFDAGLTPEQAKVAKGMGVGFDAYAKHLEKPKTWQDVEREVRGW